MDNLSLFRFFVFWHNLFLVVTRGILEGEILVPFSFLTPLPPPPILCSASWSTKRPLPIFTIIPDNQAYKSKMCTVFNLHFLMKPLLREPRVLKDPPYFQLGINPIQKSTCEIQNQATPTTTSPALTKNLVQILVKTDVSNTSTNCR